MGIAAAGGRGAAAPAGARDLLCRQRAHAGGRRQPGRHWAPWWKARAAEGHELASHTWDHAYWRADLPGRERAFASAPRPARGPGAPPGPRRATARTSEQASERLALHRPEARCRCSARRAARPRRACWPRPSACGYAHVGWSPAGFLGDELPSDRTPTTRSCKSGAEDIRPGDILLAHLGIWSRQDPWAPAVLEPLIAGLKARGFVLPHPAPAPRNTAAGSRSTRAEQDLHDDGAADLSPAQQWLFEALIGAGDAFRHLGWATCSKTATSPPAGCWLGLLQIAVMLLVIGPLQRLWPAEPVTDRAAIRVDVLYTLLHRLGLFKLAMFFTSRRWLTTPSAQLRVARPAHAAPGPAVARRHRRALASFVLYLLVFDLLGYLAAPRPAPVGLVVAAARRAPLAAPDDDVERQPQPPAGQRHHRRRGRVVAILIGVAPSQFVWLVAADPADRKPAARQPALSFGRVGERLLVSPRFHRRHHAIGIGRAEARRSGRAQRRQLRGAVPAGGTCCWVRPTSAALRAHRHPRPGGAGARLRARLLGAAVAGAAGRPGWAAA
jgi:hypothetical protein